MSTCPDCGTTLGPGRLACPACGRLRHRERLEALAAQAQTAEAQAQPAGALAAWREALDLLPEGSPQHGQVLAKVTALSRNTDGATKTTSSRPPWASLGALGAVGLLLWKFKAVLAFIVTKGKFLLLGLSKSGTVLTMIASFGVYWAAFGWWFAAGLVVSIYIHEMGHVAALTRLGIRASAPMFIPGFGALVRMEQYPVEPREDARVGLAGPIWGLGAALAAAGIWLISGHPAWAAIAAFGAWINLFNLLPLGPLDGGRGFRALSRWQRVAATASLVVGALVSGDGLLWLLAAVGAVRVFQSGAPEQGDSRAAIEYVGLVLALSGLLRVLPALHG